MNIISKKMADFSEKVLNEQIDINKKRSKKLVKDYKNYSKQSLDIYKNNKKNIHISDDILDDINFLNLDDELYKESKKLSREHYKTLDVNLKESFYISYLFYNTFVKEFVDNKRVIKEVDYNDYDKLYSLDFKGKTLEERMNSFSFSLNKDIETILKDGIRNNKSTDVIKRELDHKLNSLYNRFEGLSTTETNRIYNLEQYNEIMNDEYAQRIIIISTLDNKTSSICRKKDGLILDKNDITQDDLPPFHPHCRSSFGPFIREAETRLNNISKKEIEYISFDQFYKKYLK